MTVEITLSQTEETITNSTLIQEEEADKIITRAEAEISTHTMAKEDKEETRLWMSNLLYSEIL